MNIRSPLAVMAALSVVVSLQLACARTSGPEGTSADASDTATPRTPWGDPDISGTWEDQDDIGIPIEKPAPGREQIAETQEEAFELADARGGSTGAGPGWWYEARPSTPGRTYSLIDPPDGTLPPLTAQAQVSFGQPGGNAVPRSYRDFSVTTRCISRGLAMIPNGYQYNNAYEIVQGPDYVAIRHEMIHDVRMIPLDGRPHVSPAIRLWLGDPRGHWEGGTLVVETTNLHDQSPLPGVRGVNLPVNAKTVVTERFTRQGADRLMYELTVNNPDLYTRPWTLAVPMKSDPTYQIFEYACHEGNQAPMNILAGAAADSND